MYRKTVQCYVFLLTLLDISLNNRLTAQGKSHDVTVQDSLIEGITFQEWGKESSGGGGSVESLRLSPPALSFGRAALAAAHRLTVTLTNTANTTVHLASVAGTTPDFHASFFESKTLPPAGNTSFSVVYLGRREGPVAAHLYIHTSLGVHKYPVSAEGVASEWGVWPLVGLRVPLDASLEPLLELYNPTDQPVQVSEVYSSGGWVSLSLPDGAGGEDAGGGDDSGDGEKEENSGEKKEGSGFGGAAWRVPPRESRPIVRLRLRPPSATDRPRPAYIRIKGDMVGGGAGGLVVAVEAVAAGAGAYIAPPQLRLRARGSRDKPHTWELSAGNSGSSPVDLEGAVWGARCERSPPAAVDQADGAHAAQAPARANGARSEGAEVRVVHSQLAPHSPPQPAMQLTLHYDRLWASYENKAGAEATSEAWCAGWVVGGGAAMPYSVHLLEGTLALSPPSLDIVTVAGGSVTREVRARNEFPVPLHLHSAHFGPLLAKHFECSSLLPLVLGPGQEAVVARLAGAAPPPLRDVITLTTNLTAYELPVTVHTGTLQLEWEWPNSSDGTLRLGTVGAMQTRRVGLRLHNAGPRALCATLLRARLPAAAALTLAACAPPGDQHPCRCVEAGQWAQAWLTVVAPAQEGELEGTVWVGTPHATTRSAVTLTVRAGRVHAPPVSLPPAAPWVNSWAPLVVDNSMGVSMRVLNVTPEVHDPAIHFEVEGGVIAAGWRGAVGRLVYAPERACRPTCYTGLQPTDTEDALWWERGLAPDEASLARDEEHMLARRALFARHTPAANLTLRLHTTEVVQIPVLGSVPLAWPTLAAGWPAGGALAPVGEPSTHTLTVHNPATTPLLVQPVLRAPRTPPDHLPDELKSLSEEWSWSDEAFSLGAWSGDGEPTGELPAPALLLPPHGTAKLAVTFSPAHADVRATYLYLRNNLTIVEIIPIWGRGAHPSFELGGRRAGAGAGAGAVWLTLEVASCGAAARTLALRNTGVVPLRLRDWRVAGRACAARGFRLQPCAPATLRPNDTRTLRLSYSPDYTLARATAALTVRADAAKAEFRLRAVAPARLLRACALEAPRPPFDPPLRAAGAALALAALAAVLAAAALDAERALRRARHARPPPAPPTRAPLDLRAAARVPPPPAPPVRRRRAPRRPPAPDPRAPLAERRAFERWRAEVLRRADREDDHSSEDGAPEGTPPTTPPRHASPPRSSPSPSRDDVDVEEDAARPSSDDNGRSGDSSVGSDSSPGDDLEGRDDSEPEINPPPPHDRPPTAPDPPDDDTPQDRPDVRRERRPRRDPGETPRRTERRAPENGENRPRGPPARAHGRRTTGGRRRNGERTGGSPPQCPPATTVETRAPAAVRWGASFSSVVAAGAGAGNNTGPTPLPPIGSDVRRRAEERERPPDQSLFYFNGEQVPAPTDAFPWRAPPPMDRPQYPPPVHDYLNDFDEAHSPQYGSVWAGGAWAWGGGLGVRPPPGFAPQPPAPAPRAYDPFRSLAAIWAPAGGGLDWRAPNPGPTGPPADEPRPDE